MKARKELTGLEKDPKYIRKLIRKAREIADCVNPAELSADALIEFQANMKWLRWTEFINRPSSIKRIEDEARKKKRPLTPIEIEFMFETDIKKLEMN
jgi:hypothetical protein